MDADREKLKSMFDVTLLRATATASEVESFCAAVMSHGFSQLCVNPIHVRRAAGILRGSSVKVVTVIGFPLGATTTACKAFEAREAVVHGASELDMVMDIGGLLEGDLASVEQDIAAVVRSGAIVKVIIETPLLNEAQKVIACQLAMQSGAQFVKTCTGFSVDPIALYEDVRLMRQTVGAAIGVKASGRVGTYHRVAALMEAGASRFGMLVEQALQIMAGYDVTHRSE